MAYYLNLFSPETWIAFTERGADVTGFVEGMLSRAEGAIKQDDILICYMTVISRWCGAVRVVSDAYVDDTPLFGVAETYPVRFRVEPIVVLEPNFAIPFRDEVLNNMSLMRPREGRQPVIRGFIRGSLNEFSEGDGQMLLALIQRQHDDNRRIYPLTQAHQSILDRARENVFVEPNDFEDEVDEPIVIVDERPSDPESYTIDDIVNEGCFVELDKLTKILARLRAKKNVILQGPPGTGKTWLAKKIAYALIGERGSDKVRSIQFHPNLSYEDFVRGWRPSGDGKLSLIDGPFVEMIDRAKQDPDSTYVMVIEEINRGNPAQILGEMLTLLESDKRNSDEALELTYRRTKVERAYVPENLHVIGTMNLADRSLAMVDFALRRRFAFFNLEPIFGNAWQNWMRENFNLEPAFLVGIERRMNALNNQIASDRDLGLQFRVGHSYLAPSPKSEVGNPEDWFKDTVEAEIFPLLEEYWFDKRDELAQAKRNLLRDL